MRDKLGIENRSAGYGMTETASVCATMSGPVFDLKPMAAGIISPIIDLRVVDPAGNVLPSGSEGEIQLRGVTVTPGYWQRDDLTQEAFTPDGWLRTGDLGTIDDEPFPAHHRADQGNRHPRRREHRSHRDRERGLPTPIGQGGRGLRRPRRRHGRGIGDGVPPPARFRTSPRTNCVPTCATRCQPFKVPKYLRAEPTNHCPATPVEKIHRLALRNSFVAN